MFKNYVFQETLKQVSEIHACLKDRLPDTKEKFSLT